MAESIRGLRVGLETRIGIGIEVGQGMSTQLDTVASEAAEVLAREETPGNGEWKVILCFTQSINGLQWGEPVVSENNVTG